MAIEPALTQNGPMLKQIGPMLVQAPRTFGTLDEALLAAQAALAEATAAYQALLADANATQEELDAAAAALAAAQGDVAAITAQLAAANSLIAELQDAGLSLYSSYTPLATTYYVSSTYGNDSNPGTLERPWASLTKVNQARFNPADTVCFRCGDTFTTGVPLSITASAGVPGAPITFTYYGDVDDGFPIIDAGQSVIGTTASWTEVNTANPPVESAGSTRWAQVFATASVPDHPVVVFDGVTGSFKTSVASVTAAAAPCYRFVNGYFYVGSTANPATEFGTIRMTRGGIDQCINISTDFISVNGINCQFGNTNVLTLNDPTNGNTFVDMDIRWCAGNGVAIRGRDHWFLNVASHDNGNDDSGQGKGGFSFRQSQSTTLDSETMDRIHMVDCDSYNNAEDGFIAENSSRGSDSWTYFTGCRAWDNGENAIDWKRGNYSALRCHFDTRSTQQALTIQQRTRQPIIQDSIIGSNRGTGGAADLQEGVYLGVSGSSIVSRRNFWHSNGVTITIQLGFYLGDFESDVVVGNVATSTSGIFIMSTAGDKQNTARHCEFVNRGAGNVIRWSTGNNGRLQLKNIGSSVFTVGRTIQGASSGATGNIVSFVAATTGSASTNAYMTMNTRNGIQFIDSENLFETIASGGSGVTIAQADGVAAASDLWMQSCLIQQSGSTGFFLHSIGPFNGVSGLNNTYLRQNGTTTSAFCLCTGTAGTTSTASVTYSVAQANAGTMNGVFPGLFNTSSTTGSTAAVSTNAFPSITVSAVVRTGTTVAITAPDHGFTQRGQVLYLTGGDQAEYRGAWFVSEIDGTTVSFEIWPNYDDVTSPGTGTFVLWNYMPSAAALPTLALRGGAQNSSYLDKDGIPWASVTATFAQGAYASTRA